MTARLVLVAALTGLLATPVPAGALSPSNATWSVSNNLVTAGDVTYAWSFQTAAVGMIKTIAFVVSGSGLGGTPAIGMSYGVGAGTVVRSGQTITYTIATPVSGSIGIPIFLQITGLSNSATAGSYTSGIVTRSAGSATIEAIATNGVALAAKGTAVAVSIRRSLAFSITLEPADGAPVIVLGVKGNVGSAYTLTVHDGATPADALTYRVTANYI